MTITKSLRFLQHKQNNMYHGIEDFLNDWKNEQSYTVKILSNITEETKNIKIDANVRSLERLAWHITQTLTEMGTRAGLFDADVLEHEPIPAHFSEVIASYQKYAELLAKAVNGKWTDSTLEDLVDMYGEQWKKGKILSVLIAHEAHHRSQMTIVMRMVGLPVPGIYGPSKEEWAAMGLPAME